MSNTTSSAAQTLAGMTVVDLDVEVITADDAMDEIVLRRGYVRFSDPRAFVRLVGCVALSRRGDQCKVRLDDGRTVYVHEDSLVLHDDQPGATEAGIEQSRREIPGIDPVQAYYRARGREIALRDMAQRRADAMRGVLLHGFGGSAMSAAA